MTDLGSTQFAPLDDRFGLQKTPGGVWVPWVRGEGGSLEALGEGGDGLVLAEGLHVDKAAVEAAEGDELAVGAALDDGAVVHNDDFVGVADGGEAVGDDDAGAPQHELVEGLLDGVLALGVEGAGGLVEDEDGRVFEYGAGYGEALALAAAEVEAAVADGGVVALFHEGDKLVGMCHLCGTSHVVDAVVGTAEGDVVGHGVVEEDAVLRHKAYLCAEAVDVEAGEG